MARVVVLGGGFGGIPTAVELRERLADADEVVLVDRGKDFAMGLRKTWHLLGISPLAYGTRHLDALRSRGINVMRGEVTTIDPTERIVVVEEESIAADALVIALGAVHDMDAIPGLVTYGSDAWTREQIDHARAAVDSFRGGRVVVGITGAPYSCPPGPFELALLLTDRLEERGVEAEITVFGPGAIALPLLGVEGSRPLDERLAERGVAYLGGRVPASVRPGAVEFTSGEPLAFDLLLVVPPHRVPRVLVDAGLAPESGWVNVDRSTLETAWPGVFAIGDCTAIGLSNGMALPKAGLFAEREGEVVAQRIAATLQDRIPEATFDGVGSCFAEMGGGEASEVRGSFYAEPPDVVLTAPSAEQRAAKERFESERLTRWFGS